MSLRIAVVGCTHGELDLLYAAIADANAADASGRAVDLLICCGDFQACRNEADLSCMSCPDRYLAMHEFHRYYSGAATAPVPTLFIGGNHEASNHLAELPLGGWAAPRILYLGTSGVVNFGGLRIGGVSGIHKGYSFWQGYHERPPYSEDAIKSVNHQRAFDFWRMAHCCAAGGGGSDGGGPMDVFLTHDWPAGVVEYGDKATLLRQKPFFAEEVAAGTLGSPPAMQLLHSLRPRFWFAGHLHVKFAALIPHHGAAGGEASGSAGGGAAPPAPTAFTRFLALDKPEGRRDFLQILDIPLPPHCAANPPARVFHYDTFWCAVLAATHSATPTGRAMPGGRALPPPRAPTPSHLAATAAALAAAAAAAAGADAAAVAAASAYASAHPLRPIPMPLTFAPTAALHTGDRGFSGRRSAAFQQGNPQMDFFLAALGLPHATTVPVAGAQQGGVGGGSCWCCCWWQQRWL